MTAGRAINGFCWAFSGLCLLIAAIAGASGMSGGAMASIVLLGLAGLGYGIKIFVTRTSYFIHTAIYVLPILAVVLLVVLVQS